MFELKGIPQQTVHAAYELEMHVCLIIFGIASYETYRSLLVHSTSFNSTTQALGASLLRLVQGESHESIPYCIRLSASRSLILERLKKCSKRACC
jgi:hypothetical protein